jgi:rubrerythrin
MSAVRSREPPECHDEPTFELRCTACGYGAIVSIAPAACPMCHGSVWEYVAPAVRTTTGKEQP